MPTVEELLQSLLLSIEEEQAIKNKSIDKIPINPTPQGWSGPALRKALAESVTGTSASVLKSLKEKLSLVKTTIEAVAQNTVELRVHEAYIQWKVVESVTWNNLISLEELAGSLLIVQPETPSGIPVNAIWVDTNG